MPPLLRKPRALAPGDCIGIVAPASPVREELLAQGEAALRSLGFRVRRGDHLLARFRYTAGRDDERAADLIALLGDPEVRAVLYARGGYGSLPLLPALGPALVAADPKLVIGASDATSLLLWALRAGVTCLHGPMAAREIAEGRVDLDELNAHLTSPAPSGLLRAPEARLLHPGTGQPVEGWLTGGCLSLVVASLGTPWEIETDGALLFLEDVETKPYQIDRMLTQLRQAGKLARVRGLLFGEMLRCRQHADQGYELDQVLADLTADLGVPVLAGLPCGHTEGVHRPLPFGVQARLSPGPAQLTLLESAVA